MAGAQSTSRGVFLLSAIPAPFPQSIPARVAALLTPCELEVLHLIGSGQTTRAIAAVLHRSVKTIETYRSRMVRKLGLGHPTALAQWACRFVHGAGTTGARYP